MRLDEGKCWVGCCIQSGWWWWEWKRKEKSQKIQKSCLIKIKLRYMVKRFYLWTRKGHLMTNIFIAILELNNHRSRVKCNFILLSHPSDPTILIMILTFASWDANFSQFFSFSFTPEKSVVLNRTFKSFSLDIFMG